MYIVNTDYNRAAAANARHIIVSALFNGNATLTGENIIDMTVAEAVAASDGISMGTTISSKLVMNIKAPDIPIILSGGFVQPFAGFYGINDMCPLGKFYITEAASTDDFQKKYTLTGYDGFSKTEMPYNPTITMPNTAKNIMADIALQCGIEIDPNIEYPSGTFDLLLDYTCRQYIGCFAGLLGKNARFNRDGKLTFIWYTDNGMSVDRDHQYMGGLKRITDGDFSINSITSGTSDRQLTAGTGIGISFENPFMTQEILNDIFASIGTFSYTPVTLKWRGNPTIEAGDIITAVDKSGISRTIYVMEQTLRISGGMNAEIKCFGKSEAEFAFDTNPATKRIQKVYNKLQEAIAEATKLLQGSNGGIFEVIDENDDGINDGWIIHTADGQKHIKANVNGIGITVNGGNTYSQAMTADGINADAITVGTMNAQRINVGDAHLGDVFSVVLEEDHPIITIGSSANDIQQRQTNNAITFVNGKNDEIAKFSITGAEWKDMQQMKYCGFVWTKSAANGNVRFTKARDT